VIRHQYASLSPSRIWNYRSCGQRSKRCRGNSISLSHRAKLDDNAALAKFAETLEKVCVETVEAGDMTKNLALLVGPEQKWLSTGGFLDKVDENLKKAMAA